LLAELAVDIKEGMGVNGGLLPLLVRPSGTVSRTLSAIRTSPKLISGAC